MRQLQRPFTVRPFGASTLAFLLLTAAVQSTGPARITDLESYEVYGAVLELHHQGRGVPKVFLRGETRADKHCLSGELLPVGWRGVFGDYMQKNRLPTSLDAYSRLAVPTTLIANELFDAITNEPGEWQSFWHEFPEGGEVLFQVSAVGFDKRRQRAMVYLAHHSGGQSGVGAVWLLERLAGNWVPFLTMQQCQWVE